MPAEPTPRRRGRPRGGDAGGRERILAAATQEFGDHGYDGVTIRSIAERAGVDSALVHHHFGSKADLLTAVVDVPISPAMPLAELLEGDLDGVGERLVGFVVTTWDDPAFRARGVAALRTVLGSKDQSALMMGFLSRELMARISQRVGSLGSGPLRANLVASQVVGLMTTRYVLELEPLASAPPQEVIAAIAPTIQRYLTGDLTEAETSERRSRRAPGP